MARWVVDGLSFMTDDEELIAGRVKELSARSIIELIALKDHWLKEYRNSRKIEEVSNRRRRDACHWLAAIDQLIISSASSTKKDEDPENMGISDAANYLRISESKLYKMTSSQEIPHAKIGRSLRFSKTQLDEFLDKARIGRASDTTDEEAEKHVANFPLRKKKKR